MKQGAFKAIRKFLGQRQRDLAANLGVSLKAVQSYEQGWRRIPDEIERKLLLYLSIMNRQSGAQIKMCWQIIKCDEGVRERCLVWKMDAGKECWFISGTVCRGVYLKSWEEKRLLCLKCDAFLQHLEFLKGTPLYRDLLS